MDFMMHHGEVDLVEIFIHNGSHGCVNMPRSEVSKLYNMVEIGTPVYVH